MQKLTLYRYTRPDGGISVSPIMPEVEYSVLYRLIADDGKELIDGVNHATCVDTATPDAWTEVDAEEDSDAVTETD